MVCLYCGYDCLHVMCRDCEILHYLDDTDVHALFGRFWCDVCCRWSQAVHQCEKSDKYCSTQKCFNFHEPGLAMCEECNTTAIVQFLVDDLLPVLRIKFRNLLDEGELFAAGRHVPYAEGLRLAIWYQKWRN